MTRIKLCGMRRPEDILAANRLLPEYVGFICCDRFWRYVAPETVRELGALLAPGIQKVGVFVDQPVELVAELLTSGTIDIAQLHGSEDEDYITRLRSLTDRPVTKVFKVRTAEDIERAEKSSADYILLDSGTGTGVTFDWALLREIRRPWFLAGGLSPENAGEAVTRFAPWAVDVSSGIETDKVKDPEKMAAFVQAVRTAAQSPEA